jgi:RNA polymerase sigma factor (sigma-70 family)
VRREFPSTLKTLVRKAGRGDRDALERLSGLYREPVYGYLRGRGFMGDAADELTQQVFLAVVQDGAVAGWDESKGRFRQFLIGVIRNTIRDERRRGAARKRGGGRALQSLDASRDPDDAPAVARVAQDADDDEFDRLWMLNLARQALQRVKADCERSGRPYHEALRLHVFERRSYAQIAEALGVKVQDVKNYLHRARGMLKPHVERLIAATCPSLETYRREAQYLMRLLP